MRLPRMTTWRWKVTMAILTAILIAPGARAATAPDAVMIGEGLTVKGHSWVIDTQARVHAPLRELLASIQMDESKLAPLSKEQSRLEDEIASAKAQPDPQSKDNKDDKKMSQEKEKNIRSAEQALANFKSTKGSEMAPLQREIFELRQEFSAGLEKRYRSLWEQQEIRTALFEYNRTAETPLVLGPIASVPEYSAQLRRIAATYLTDRKGLTFETNSSRLLVPAEVAVVELSSTVRKSEKALAAAEARAKVKPKVVELSERRKTLAAQLARAPADRKGLLAAQISIVDGQIKRLPPGEDNAKDAAAAQAANVAKAREEFAQAVQALRRGVDAAAQERQKVETDPEVKAVLDLIKKKLRGPGEIAQPSGYKSILKSLADSEKAIDRKP